MKDNVCVFTITDDNYVKYAEVMIKSFFLSNKWFDGDFKVLYDNFLVVLSDENIKKLESINKNVKCVRVDGGKYAYNANKLLKTIRKNWWICCMLKFEMFLMDYDKILYLDADMLVINDISELLDMDLPIAMAGHDCEYVTEPVLRNNEYLNAGLIYLGNRKYINERTFNDMMKFIENINYKKIYVFGNTKVEYFTMCEQDVMNIYFKKKDIYILPQKFNAQYVNKEWSYKNMNYPEWDVTDEVIIHYIHKPDSKGTEHLPVCKIWEKYIDIDCE